MTVKEVQRMALEKQCFSDVEAILSHRYDNGADFWTTPEKPLTEQDNYSRRPLVAFPACLTKSRMTAAATTGRIYPNPRHAPSADTSRL